LPKLFVDGISVSTAIFAVVDHGVTLFVVPVKVLALFNVVASELLVVLASYCTCHPDA
jgi:hypothetical protein